MTEPAIEKHYRVKELCSILGLSDRSVRRLIASEADVVVLPEKKARFKRAYQTVWCQNPSCAGYSPGLVA